MRLEVLGLQRFQSSFIHEVTATLNVHVKEGS